MTFEAPGSAVGGAQVRVRFQGADRLLDSGSSYRIGRDPQSDIVVNDPRVSWNHAVLQHQDGGWVLEDPGSTNGTFSGGERVRRVAISGDCSVRLGHPADGPQLTCTPIGPGPQRPGTVRVQAPAARWASEQAPPASAQPVPEQRVPQQRSPAPAAAAGPAVMA